MIKEKTTEAVINNINIPINFDQEWIYDLQEKYSNDGPWDSWKGFQLAFQAENKLQINTFDNLQCLSQLPGFSPFTHQIEAAKKVINIMHGRAILADEVGLGKTIEAGLIIKEYLIRGLVKNVLILVPSSLVFQWTRELNQKLGISAIAFKKEWMWEKYNIIVASMDTAKRTPHSDHILNKQYDLLIVDEAHKLKNRKTKNWEFINKINKKYILLLTATPVQNDITELFNLVTILKPGQFGQYSSFQKEFMKDKRNPKNKELLKKEIDKVMIRNRRANELKEINFTKRIVENIPITLTAEEDELYQEITAFVKKNYYNFKGYSQNPFVLITLQREICSSRDAAFITLINLFKNSGENESLKNEILKLVQIAKKVNLQSKADKSIDLIKQINDKVIIFTEYRATQEYLIQRLSDENIKSVPYRGGFNKGKKDWMKELFQKNIQVMVATEAGGEGINLQFCNHIINYDLPWNPMRVEQRIGRVQRIGQTKDVYIYNFSTNNTIEEHILYLLNDKIQMFENVIGSLETILENNNLDKIESNIIDIMINSKNNKDLRKQISSLGNEYTNKLNTT